MRLLAFLSLMLALASPVRAGDVRLYVIETVTGEPIGWQRESRDSDGSESIERQLAYRVDSHGLQQQYLRLERMAGSASPVVIMGKSPADAKRVHPRSVTDLTSVHRVIAAASGTPINGFRVLDPGEEHPIVVDQRDAARFVAAWLVERGNVGLEPLIRQPRLEGDWVFRFNPASTSLSGPGAPANLAHPMKDAPYDIPASARRGHIRYTLFSPAGAGIPLPETGEQRVVRTADAGVQVDVCANCGPGLSTDPVDLARWTGSTAWMETQAPEISQAAARARRDAKSDTEVMQRLSRIARKRLKGVDYDGHYSALAAWHRRRGDCTEDAVLLAALARAAGIPARVAPSPAHERPADHGTPGLAYEREAYHGTASAFLPHTWTLAFVDGEWRSFDLSLGRFSAGHIAFAIADGEAAAIQSGWQLAAMVELRDMAEVRSSARPAR